MLNFEESKLQMAATRVEESDLRLRRVSISRIMLRAMSMEGIGVEYLMVLPTVSKAKDRLSINCKTSL